MSEIDDENTDSPNGGEETPEETPGKTQETLKESDDEESDDSADVARLKKLNIKLYERAKKAEGFIKDEQGDWVKKPKEPETPKPEKVETELSAKDAIVLMKAGVDNDEDIDEVVRFAKFQNLSVGKALESKTMKTILAERKEERTTAEATHTGKSKKSSPSVSDETLLANASQGNFPDDPAALAKARLAQKFNKPK